MAVNVHKTVAITNGRTKAPRGYGVTVVGESYAWAQDEPQPAKVVAPRREAAKPKSQDCRCGCGGQTRGGRFLPGHDGRLKGVLMGRAKAGDVAAAEELASLGWSRFIPLVVAPEPAPAPEPVAEPVVAAKKRDLTVRGKAAKAAKVA
jgi:hypothetical protein